MRFWQWGQADAEFADWAASETQHRTPFGPWGQTANDSEFDAEVDPATLELGDVIGFVHEVCLRILKTQLKAKLGQVPILLSADIVFTHSEYGTNGSGTWESRRMITIWDQGDSSNWRYDKSLDLDWYQDRKHIVRGQDVESAAADTGTWSHVYGAGNFDQSRFPLKSVLERALRDNTDIYAHLSCYHVNGQVPAGRTQVIFNEPTVFSRRPYLDVAYFYPIEFYRDDGSGDPDLTSPVTDDPGDEYYLGAVEPGQTGVAVKCHLRNYSGQTQQVEIFDDHPEYTTPITRAGTSQLDFINLADNAVSQKYTAIFYSATQYEVQAVTYRDNAISLHPTINADASWRGAVGSDFTAPDGGLRIPAAAWQPGTANNDEYEIGVRGQTTDSAWPADSNDQIEITHDNAGSPDAAGWRPCLGRREETRAQVTVDATTKFFPTRKVDPVDWPVATKAFVMDATNINEGQIASVQEADIGTPAFSGSGTDDLSVSGNYNGVWTDTLRIRIDATGTPDTFEVSFDGGSTYPVTGVSITGSAQLIADGIYVTFGSTTGHTLNDYWDMTVEAWGLELSGLTANSNVYNSGSRIGTTLPVRDFSPAVFTTVDQDSGVSQGSPARIFVASTVGFTPSQQVFIQSPQNPDTAEVRTVDSVQAGQYIDVTVALTQDYTNGDLVTVIDSGWKEYWSRPIAEITTAEELKRLRFNARML